SKVPYLYQAETRSLVPGAGDLPPQRAVATRDGRVAFVGVQEGPLRYAQAGRNQLVVLNADGSLPAAGPLGPELAKLSGSAANLALTPDQKTLYAAGLREGNFQGKATHTILQFGWADATPLVFVGVKGQAGDDEKHLNDPRGLAVDKEGNVYVAD